MPKKAQGYMDKVLALGAELATKHPTGHAVIEVRHDRKCPILNGGKRCRCDPEVVLVEVAK